MTSLSLLYRAGLALLTIGIYVNTLPNTTTEGEPIALLGIFVILFTFVVYLLELGRQSLRLYGGSDPFSDWEDHE